MREKMMSRWFSLGVVTLVLFASFASIGSIWLPGGNDNEKRIPSLRPNYMDPKPEQSRGLVERYIRPPRDEDAVDPFLRERMVEAKLDEELEVIVQFTDALEAGDRAFLESLNVEVCHTFVDFEAYYCKATSDQIEEMNADQRVFYIEYNEDLVYHMDLSLEAIKATDTWYSIIQSADGATEEERIDGTGVTAVVLDSGVDAGHPDLDYKTKTIMNLKSDTNFVWTEAENTDTSSGHGTHCAGTVGGNGDASGGARRGVAPGARLIGLSTGEAVVILNALGALEWVYQHSKPHNNPYNIRVVSNSWGAGGGTYNPNDSISMAINKITYENNVVCVFAAGNSGGEGEDIRSSNYGNTPAAICVAAAERDGSGIASFSSRGQNGLNSTYPDIAAPGVRIWSTAARRTLISAMTKQGAEVIDPYYFAISGTSMATPHISGVVALLWQACPSMGISHTRDHYEEKDPEWWGRDDTRMHESELIMKASADFINRTEGNGIPDNWSVGYYEKNYDFSQGYGLVNVRQAVALAKTLQELRTRDFDNDGAPDYPNASVDDAVKQYMKVIKTKNIHYSSSKLSAGWSGEWTRFTNQTNSNDRLETDQSHFIFVPENAQRMVLDLTYNTVSIPEFSAATLALVADANMDGTIDWRQNLGGLLSGEKHSEIPLDSGELAKHRNSQWMFNIEGRGFDVTLLDLLQGSSYSEVTVEYQVGMEIHLAEVPKEENNITFLSTQSSYSPLEPMDSRNSHTTEGYYLRRQVFDMSEVGPVVEPPVKTDRRSSIFQSLLWLILAALAILIALGIYLAKKGKLPQVGKKKHEVEG